MLSSIYTKIRTRVSIVDIVSSYVKLRKKGTHYSALCPFHHEKTPSFTIQASRGRYHCFGCGAHGDVIDFIKHVDGVNTIDAVKKLAEYGNIEFRTQDFSQDQAVRDELAVLKNCLEDVCCTFFEALRSKEVALTYLKGRGISVHCQEAFSLGWCDKAVMKTVRERYSTETLINVGLITKASQRNFFEDRIMFPIINTKKEVIGFGGRSLREQQTPKYLNSPETALFVKHQTLYGIDHLKLDQPCLLVEGYLDVLACWGNIPAVSCLGTALSQEHLCQLWSITSEPILCFDGDVAGVRATSKAICTALPTLSPGKTLRIANLPSGQDPQSIVQYQGWSAMSSILERSLTLFESLYRTVFSKEAVSIPERRAKAVLSWREYVSLIQDPEVRSAYRAFFQDHFYKKWSKTLKEKVEAPQVFSGIGIEILLGALCMFPALCLEVQELLIQMHCPEAYVCVQDSLIEWVNLYADDAEFESRMKERFSHAPWYPRLTHKVGPHVVGWEELELCDLREQWIEVFNAYQTQYYVEGVRETLKKNSELLFSQWEELKLLTF